MSSLRILFACCLCALAGACAKQGQPAAENGQPPAEPPTPKDGPLEMKFVPLPNGTFYMGGGGGKAGSKTEIKEDFEIAIYPVTQGQWQAVMGNNPSCFSRNGDEKNRVKDIKEEELKWFPVERVSRVDVDVFIKKLNEKEAGRGYLYRLPTEAEWEYACRGGATSEQECSFDFYFDKPTNELTPNQANFLLPGRNSLSVGRPTKVGSYAPNKLGLYDMHGNVSQWCADLYEPKNTTAVFLVDRNTNVASLRVPVLRGGSCYTFASGCRAAARQFSVPGGQRQSHFGFRLARVPPSGK
jgi:formylglycine-generating enzyme required for sulfatase activity